MDALFNAHSRPNGTTHFSAGIKPSISPEAESSQTGVSVEYAPAEGKQWFILRVAYGRIKTAKELISSCGMEYYIPMLHTVKIIKGKREKVTRPLLYNLAFVYAFPEDMKELIDKNPRSACLSYYYNHFETNEYGKNPPLVVDYDKMMNFIRATRLDNEHIRIVNPSQCRYKSGDTVRVIEGEFKGVEGRVARVAGQQRVIVELSGLCLVATAYIPSAFIEKKK